MNTKIDPPDTATPPVLSHSPEDHSTDLLPSSNPPTDSNSSTTDNMSDRADLPSHEQGIADDNPAASSHSSPSPVFHRFKDLPPELRKMIWEFALPEPRVVQLPIKFKNYASVQRCCDLVNHIFAFRHISTEALQIVEKSYEKLYLNPSESHFNVPDEIPFLYVDYAKDTIYVEDFKTKHKVFKNLSRVEHLAIGAEDFNKWEVEIFLGQYALIAGVFSWRHVRSFCPALKKISFVHHPVLSTLDSPSDEERIAKYAKILTFIESPRYEMYKAHKSFMPPSHKMEVLRREAFCDRFIENFTKGIVNKVPEERKIDVVTVWKAGRERNSSVWHLEYISGQITQVTATGNEYYQEHWHTEHIRLPEDGNLLNCLKGIPRSHDKVLCANCGVSRWKVGCNEAFWLNDEDLETSTPEFTKTLMKRGS